MCMKLFTLRAKLKLHPKSGFTWIRFNSICDCLYYKRRNWVSIRANFSLNAGLAYSAQPLVGHFICWQVQLRLIPNKVAKVKKLSVTSFKFLSPIETDSAAPLVLLYNWLISSVHHFHQSLILMLSSFFQAGRSTVHLAAHHYARA